jgi:threonine dehydrogenase-like Zn-dependent dehydrogenase
MNKRLVCVREGVVDWQPIEPRSLSAGQVRVKNRFGAEKHGTMMAFYKGYANRRGSWDAEARIHRPDGVLWNYPIPLGNMQMGTIVEVGERAGGHAVGDTVFFGGAFQEESVVALDELRVLPGVDWKSGMLLDPAEYAIGAIRDGNLRLGDNVAVFGLGAIGLVAVQACVAAGANRVIAIDPMANRRQAAESCGAGSVLDPVGVDVGQILRDRTGGLGPDVIIDFSGNRSALQAALRGISYGGTIVCGAFPAPHESGLDFGGEAHMNRPKIVFSRACSDPNPDHPRWDWQRIREESARLIVSGKLQGEPIVAEPIRFEALLDNYPRIPSGDSDTIKLSVVY